jgi:hypothetical protein
MGVVVNLSDRFCPEPSPEALIALLAVRHACETIRFAFRSGEIIDPYRPALEHLADLLEALAGAA